MKVLMVVLEVRGSGIFQYTLLLARALSKIVDVSVIVPSEADVPPITGNLNILHIPVGASKKTFILNTLDVSKILGFKKVIMDEKPDVIHFRNPYVIWPVPILPLLRRYCGLLCGLPDGYFLPGQMRPDKLIARDMHIRLSHCITVESEYDKLILKKQGVTKPCFVIPHGVNTLYPFEAMDEGKEEDVVLFFGSIDGEYKGAKYLLEAAHILKKTLPNAKILLAGSGNIQKFQPILKGLTNVDIVNRFIPHDEVHLFFRRAKVVVCPYIYRVNSGVIPLALSFGKPLIVTDKLRDMVMNGRIGLIVPSRDSKALAHAIEKLLTDEELRHRIKNNVELAVKQRYNWSNISKTALEAYEFAARLARQDSVKLSWVK